MTESLALAEPSPTVRQQAAVALQRSAFVSFAIWFPPNATMQGPSCWAHENPGNCVGCRRMRDDDSPRPRCAPYAAPPTLAPMLWRLSGGRFPGDCADLRERILPFGARECEGSAP